MEFDIYVNRQQGFYWLSGWFTPRKSQIHFPCSENFFDESLMSIEHYIVNLLSQ